MEKILEKNKRTSVVRIGPKHQITISKNIFDKFGLTVGDFLEATVQKEGILMKPKRLAKREFLPRLTQKEQNMAIVLRKKMTKIQKDLVNSHGLTNREINLAIKLSLIDEDQSWWWKEFWQKREREAEKDIQQNRLSETFSTIDDLVGHLN